MTASQDGTTTKRRRARRPTEAAARLERLRQRNAGQLEAQREAERRIEAALKTYVDADVSISTVEQIREQQAGAVWQLNDAGRTLEQIAELLELPQKEARRLLAAGRRAANPDATDQPGQDIESRGAPPAGQQPPRSIRTERAAPG